MVNNILNIVKNLFLPAKTIFASPVFTMEKPFFSTGWQKPANPGNFIYNKVLNKRTNERKT